MNAKEIAFMLSFIVKDSKREEEIMKRYQNEPVEVFLQKWGLLTQGLVDSDKHVPVPQNAYRADRALRDYYLYKSSTFNWKRSNRRI